jgi:predicted nucleic acid-binding protein
MSNVLIDTNVLVYAYDQNAPERRTVALAVLSQFAITASGQLSVQCLAEFFSTATRKLKPPLTPAQAITQVELLARSYAVLDLTLPMVMEAARGVRDHQLAYYDAQIWATAKLHQIPVIFTEDFASGSILEGVRFVNPFAADFVLETWA